MRRRPPRSEFQKEENQSSCAPRSRNTCMAAIAMLRLPNPSQSSFAAALVSRLPQKERYAGECERPKGTLI